MRNATIRKIQSEPRPDHRSRFDAAQAAIDAANACDPNREKLDGEWVPKELLYGRRMSTWMAKLYPDASQELKLAARCQHIARWRWPRADYPEGRKGYLAWRRDLARFHGEMSAKILKDAGYQRKTAERVASLLRKERLKSDPEVQALEDVACIVFLRHGLAEFAETQPQEKVIQILRRTWRKMSHVGQTAALELPLDPTSARLISSALEDQPA